MHMQTEDEQLARTSLESAQTWPTRSPAKRIEEAQLHATIAVAYATLAAVNRLHRIASVLEDR